MRGKIAQQGLASIRVMQDAPEEYARLAAWLSDPRVLDYYEGRDHPYSLEMVMAKFNPTARAAIHETLCMLEYQGTAIGYLQFYPVDEEGRQEYQFDEPGDTWALDLFIGEPEYWNRGLGTLFVGMLVGYLFDQERADWVILDPHVDNERAIRVYEKCGFRKLKLLPKHELHEGRLADCWLMGVRRTA